MGILGTIGGVVGKFIPGFGGSSQSFVNWIYASIGLKSPTELLQEYKGLVYSCISAIAEDVAMYEPEFYQGERKIDHEYLRILHRPNPNMSQFEFFEAIQSYLELTGEAFIYKALKENSRKPVEFYIMRPDKVEIGIKNGEVEGYIFTSDDGTRVPLETDEVLHIKMFNPMNPWRGLGTVQAGMLYIDIENDTSELQYYWMKNQATPSGIVSFKGNIKNETFDKIKKDWKDQYSGSRKAGKTLFIKKTEIEYTKLGLSLADIDLEGLTKISDSRILRIFRVPKPLLGETDSTGLGRANVEAVEYIFAKRTIEPKLIRLDDAFKRDLDNHYPGNGITVRHVSQIPEDNESKLAEDDKALGRWKTANEIRKERGLGEIKGADQLYYSFNQIPITEGSTRVENSGIKVKIKRKHTHSDQCGCEKKKDINEEGDTFQSFARKLSRIENKGRLDYQRELTSLLDDQEKRVLELLPAVGKSIVEIVSGTGFFLTFGRDAVSLLLLRSLYDAIQRAGELGLSLYDPPDVEFVLTQGQRDYIFDATDRLLESFNLETSELLQKQLSLGLELGETIDQLTRRVEAVYNDARGYRARRIALTESHKATNFGVAQSYLLSGFKRMQWVANATACEFCAAMDGTITEIGTPFIPKGGTIVGTDGGEYVADYDDVSYADAHPNCNCYLKAVE